MFEKPEQLVVAQQFFAMVRTPIGILKTEIPVGTFVRVSMDERVVTASDSGLVGAQRDCLIGNKLTGWVGMADLYEHAKPYVRKAERQ